MATIAIPDISVEEYFQRLERCEGTLEYYEGELWEMVGASWNHHVLVSAMAHFLLNHVNNVAYLVAFEKLMVRGLTRRAYLMPDIVIVPCPPSFTLQHGLPVFTNPILIVEVLSPSTEKHDRHEKREVYQALPDLKDYLLIDSQQRHVEHHFRDDAGHWQTTPETELTNTVHLHGLNLDIPLDTIYHRVDFSLDQPRS